MDYITLQKLNRGDHQQFLSELEIARESHTQWLAQVNQILVCGGDPRSGDLAEDAHRHCALGRWFFGVTDSRVTGSEPFVRLGHSHHRMHAAAARLLAARRGGEAIAPREYAEFSALTEELLHAIHHLEESLHDDLYAYSDLLVHLFDHAQEGVLFASEDLCIQKANEAFTRITGYAEEEVIGRRPDMLYAEPDEDDLYEKIWLGVKNRGFWEGEIWNRRKDGETYLERLAIHAIRDRDGVVTHHMAILADVTRDRQQQEQLRRTAYYDALTGLPNRMLFQDRLTREIAYARRHRALMGVLFLDLDDFRPLNERIGRERGDQLLAQVAERLKGLLRTSDSIGRFGGDEFIILAQLRNAEDAAIVGDKVVAAFAEPFELDREKIDLTASIGISLFPQHAAEGDKLIRYADFAMYHAKNHGKNHYRLFHTGEAV